MSEPDKRRRVPKPVTQSELRWLLGVSRQTINVWSYEGMPVTSVPWAKTPHYNLQDVAVWLIATDRIKFSELLNDELE